MAKRVAEANSQMTEDVNREWTRYTKELEAVGDRELGRSPACELELKGMHTTYRIWKQRVARGLGRRKMHRHAHNIQDLKQRVIES